MDLAAEQISQICTIVSIMMKTACVHGDGVEPCPFYQGGLSALNSEPLIILEECEERTMPVSSCL